LSLPPFVAVTQPLLLSRAPLPQADKYDALRAKSVEDVAMLKKVQQEASALARDKRSLQTTADSALAEVKAIREARDKLEALCRLLQKSNKEAAVRLARGMARCLQ
jgi:hypothetical protein